MTAHEFKIAVRSLKKELRKHYAEVAKRAGVSVPTVSRVLNGYFSNDKVINAAIEVRDENRLKAQQKLLKLSKAISS